MPNLNQDSYIYSEGTIVFVEKNIDLTLNNEESSKASIFLRNEAQLLQGRSNSVNSGNGQISVFQEGTASEYTYNYWGIPVQNNSTNSNFGNILFEPLSKTLSRKAEITNSYNGTANPLNISNKWIYKYTGNSYSDWKYIGNIFDVLPGEGFTMKGVSGTNTEVNIYGTMNNPGGKQRYDFRGIPNNGIITLKIKADEGKLIGNPYPSAIDLNAFLQQNESLTGIAYFWDSRPVASHYIKDYEGGYGAYSPAGGNCGYVPAVFSKYDAFGNPLSESGLGDYYARRFTPLAQGFIVIGASEGEFSFKNEYRIFTKENAETSQFKTQRLSNKDVEENISSIRLNIEFTNLYIRQLLLVFNDNSTKDADRAMDAKNLSYLDTDAGWLINDESYLIEVRPYLHDDLIPLAIKSTTNLNLSFKVVETENFSEPLYLVDSYTDTYYNLKEEVSITIEAAYVADRFKISFKDKPITEIIETEEETTPDPVPQTPEIPEVTPIYSILKPSIYQNNPLKRLEINIPEKYKEVFIEIFDSSGRKVKETSRKITEKHIEISTSNFSSGIYILKIYNQDEGIISKKVIISN
ncbi:T9SS type A sorting domain-containing protein [Gillisia sp. M10.2A]|uniref:T9SS type A sorting domain-containing protein n=1 Tax=Gillisia lutea TaxID=2909668 RepID=A0ABS9EIW0_9FLAO|nr:T9SS type A sorting domain-containing protein [Gillisia lutea]MCF4102792.1 T9SS type A sorting domain-containing protein [Gillisia lutea]